MNQTYKGNDITKVDARALSDLVSVGPATIDDLKVLDIYTVQQLRGRNPRHLYDALCERTGTRHDICMLDVFSAAVAQADNPQLPMEECQWWWWSRQRRACEDSG